MSLNLSDVFIQLDWCYRFLRGRTTEVKCHFYHIMSRVPTIKRPPQNLNLPLKVGNYAHCPFQEMITHPWDRVRKELWIGCFLKEYVTTPLSRCELHSKKCLFFTTWSQDGSQLFHLVLIWRNHTCSDWPWRRNWLCRAQRWSAGFQHSRTFHRGSRG